jgi:drug/metabolite transporter (DMT)-like permease
MASSAARAAAASRSAPPAARPRPSRGAIVANFAAVYLVWGSTYLAIRFAIETLPPFLMAGTRFLVAGALLLGWTMRPGAERRDEGIARLTLSQIVWASIVGALLLFAGNGAVVWGEQLVPSGVVSLLVAAVPIWMVLLDWARRGGKRPTTMVVAGLVTGVVGLVILVGPAGIGGAHGIDRTGAAVVLGGSLSWAVGSILSKSSRLPRSPIVATAVEMLAGGAFLVGGGLATGELGSFSLAHVSTRSLLAWGYLVAFGSLVGFTAYIWLLGKVSAARVATYAYVNPIVAVFLGWALASEPITARTVAAAAVIVLAVAMITAGRKS